jgi:hypothetical protein
MPQTTPKVKIIFRDITKLDQLKEIKKIFGEERLVDMVWDKNGYIVSYLL